MTSNATEDAAGDHLRIAGYICVQNVIRNGQHMHLEAIGCTPVEKESPLVFFCRAITQISEPKISHQILPLPKLDLPTSQIGINEKTTRRSQQGRSGSCNNTRTSSNDTVPETL